MDSGMALDGQLQALVHFTSYATCSYTSTDLVCCSLKRHGNELVARMSGLVCLQVGLTCKRPSAGDVKTRMAASDTDTLQSQSQIPPKSKLYTCGGSGG